MIKKPFLLILALLILVPKIIKAQTSEFINFIQPRQTTTLNSKLVVEGTVEQKSIKHLNLRVEPFIKKINTSATQSVITVQEGYFREETTLSPGLNLIYLETMSKNIYAVKPIFLLSPGKKDNEPSIDTWGGQSKIVFTQPASLRINENTMALKGMVSDPAVKALSIVSLNVIDFLDTSSEDRQEKKERIQYQEITVKNRQFDCKIDLTEGLNIILAKPAKGVVGFEDIQVKSVLFERQSKIIILNDPILDAAGGINIKGKITDPNIKSVDIEVKVLVCEVNNPFKIFAAVIITERAALDKNGNFFIHKSLKENKYILKSPPTIIAKANGHVATKTLLKW